MHEKSKGNSIYTFNSFLKKKFGSRVYKISLNAGFNCPHRSKEKNNGGCTYCNPASFSPPSADSSLTISEQIKIGVDFSKKRHKAEKFLAYFQTYTNTLASPEKLRTIYLEALEFPEVVGISIGTRPDCLSDKTLDLIHEISEKTFLLMELGLESSNDKTLKNINRLHTVEDFTSAIDKLKKRSINTCAHVILGLPGETIEGMLKTANYLSAIGVDGVKIHHFHIVKGTEMEKDHYKEKIKTFTIEEYRPVVIKFLEHLDPNIIIHRLVGDCPEDLLIAPVWNLGKLQLLQSIDNEMTKLNSWQGKFFSCAQGAATTIRQGKPNWTDIFAIRPKG